MKRTLLLVILLLSSSAQATLVADHNTIALFDQISDFDFQEIAETYNIFYGHTSHGSQILTGLSMLNSDESGNIPIPVVDEIWSDLGHYGSLVWEGQTRTWLSSHPETDMVIWSWCGGASDNTEDGINIYLNAMDQLESDYPEITFVYMTGHLDGTGVDGNLYRNNNIIRDFCLENGKVLFDFADIESWDPDGNYYPNETDACSWCLEWCAEETCITCYDCAHSHCFNCFQKGKSFWWLLYKVNEPTTSGVGDLSPSFSFELSQNYPNPFNPQTEVKLEIMRPGIGTLIVYDVAGNRVSTLHDGYFEAGIAYFTWNASETSGQALGSGIYFCRFQIGEEIQEIKMTLLK